MPVYPSKSVTPVWVLPTLRGLVLGMAAQGCMPRRITYPQVNGQV